MRKQREIWLAEHNEQATLPTMANTEPASGVALFIEYLKSRGVKLSGNAVDIGAGKGRNTVYLAQQGFMTWALEYIEPAITAIKELAKNRGVTDRVVCDLAEIDKPWAYQNAFFDVAIDSFSSIDIETKAGREICRDEMFRTLKPGGYALVTVCSVDDEWERELIAKSPGPEPNSTIWPQNGKFQKDYTEVELRDFYQKFEIVDVQTITKPAFKLGREGQATNLWMVLRKP